MCLGMGLFVFILFETFYISLTCMSISFTRLGKLSFIIFSYRFSIPCPLLFPVPHVADVGKLVVVPESLYIILTFLILFFFLLFKLGVFGFIISQISDLILYFIYSFVDFLVLFLCFLVPFFVCLFVS